VSSHYFDPQPATPSDRRRIPLVLPDWTAELLTDRGVFSGDRLDPGTKLLLQEAPTTELAPEANLLDLGCGYGPIAVTLAHRHPHATVWAVDVNERAIALTRDNVAALELPNVRPVLIDAADPLAAMPTDLRFDLVWSNPPIRIGKAELHALLLCWLGRLAPSGRALLVVQKHLGSDSLQTWLTQQGFAVERLTSRGGYRLLDITPTEEPRDA
jgi:16S rRNA (guanine1207-N2)-methyltransferase